MRRDAKLEQPKKASRSLSTVDLKSPEKEEKNSELRSHRAKSFFDLRKNEENDNEEEEGSKLKAFLNFFRNLRPNKEKEADKVISLGEEILEEKPKTKPKKAKKKKRKTKKQPVSSGDEENEEESEDDDDDSTLPRRNGSCVRDDSDSFSDLSLDSLTLPPEKLNRSQQRVQPSKKKKKEEGGGGFLEAETKSCASEESTESSQSNFSKLRRRFRSRKNSTIEELEEGSDRETKKQKGRRGEGKDEEKTKKKKKKKKSLMKSAEMSQESEEEEEEDPEVIVEELKTPRRGVGGRMEAENLQRGTVHLTYLSSDSDEEAAVIVDRRKQNFLEEKKGFRLLRRTPREKKNNSNSATRITPLALGGDATFSLSGPLFPSEPWIPVEYDPEREEQLDEDDFINVEQIQNILADPSLRGSVAVVDTRHYTDFLRSRILLAQHVSEFENAEGELMEEICSTFSTFIIYDANGRTLSLMDSPLSRLYDFLKSSSESNWRVFVVAGGHDKICISTRFLLSSSTSSNTAVRHLPPSSVENGFLLWGSSVDMSLPSVAQTFSVSHAVTFAGDVDAAVPPGVESMLVKVDSDSVKLFEHLEAVIKFLLLGKREENTPSKVLVVGDSPDNRASAVVVAFVMFRHHWTLRDAFTHVSARRRSMDIGKGNTKALQRLEKRLFGKLISKTTLKVVAEEDEKDEDKKKKNKRRGKKNDDEEADEYVEKKGKKKGKKDDDEEDEEVVEKKVKKKKKGKRDDEDEVEDIAEWKVKKKKKEKRDDDEEDDCSEKKVKKNILILRKDDVDLKREETEVTKRIKKQREYHVNAREPKVKDSQFSDNEVDEENETKQKRKKQQHKKKEKNGNHLNTFDDAASSASSNNRCDDDSGAKKKFRWRREKKNGDIVVPLQDEESEEEKHVRKPKKKGGLFSRRRSQPAQNEVEEDE